MARWRTNRHTRLVAACLAVLLASAACGGEDGASGSEDLIQVTYGTAGTPVVYGSIMMHVADEEGILEKYGLDVTFQNFANGADSVRALIGGGLDGTATSTSSVVNVTAEGAEVQGVIGMDKPDYYVASTDPDISTCEDLEGQTIGVDATGGARYNSMTPILASCGLTLDDVELVNFAGPPVIQALVQGQIDVANLHLDEEAFIEATSDVNVEPVISLVDVNPQTHYVMMAFQPDFIEENRDTVVRMTAAYIEARNFILDPGNTERFAEIASEYTGQPVEVAQESIGLFLDFEFWPDDDGMPEENVLGVVQEQIDAGAVTEDNAPAFEDLADPSIYPEALELIESTN